MNWRLFATALGCVGVLAGGTVAASHYFGPASQPAERPPALFLAAAQQAGTQALWPPPSGRVAFNDEMIALLIMGATVRTAAAPQPEVRDAEPQRRVSKQDPRRAQQDERARLRAARVLADREARNARAQAFEGDDVEVRVRDRHGNQLRVIRVERDAQPPRDSASGPFRLFGPFGEW